MYDPPVTRNFHQLVDRRRSNTDKKNEITHDMSLSPLPLIMSPHDLFKSFADEINTF